MLLLLLLLHWGIFRCAQTTVNVWKSMDGLGELGGLLFHCGC